VDYGFAHGVALEAAEIECVAFEFHHASAGGVAGGLRQQLLGEIHQAAVIGVGLVELEHGELGVVVGGEALVAGNCG